MHRIKFVISTLLAVYMMVSIAACKKDSAARSDSSSPSPATTTTATDTTQIPGLGVLTGQLTMDVDGTNVPAANAEVTVASHPEYKATTDAEGNFEIPNMLPGTLTIYAEGTTGTSLKLANDDSIRAAQFRDIVVAANQNTSLPSDTVLTKPGSISGTVALLNNPQNVELVGISVYVPGTSYDATTDENGVFTLSNIPAGLYLVRFDKDGLTSSEVADITVQSGEDTAVSTVYMSLSTGPSGQIVGIEGTTDITIGSAVKKVLQSHDVTANILYDSRAVLMKVAHESAFLNVDWIPVTSAYTFTASNNASAYTNFSADGTKYVYVKFADQNGLESSVYFQEFFIDTEAPSVSFVMMNGWPYIAQAAYDNVPLTISGLDSGSGVKEMLICNNSSFASCTNWITYSTSYADWILENNTKEVKTVYLKVKDYIGNISSIAFDTIEIGDYTRLPGSITENLIINNAQGPFAFDVDLVYDFDFTVNAGTHIYFPDSKNITVKGTFTVNGENGNMVELKPLIGGNSFGGFILTQGTAGPHFINHFKFGIGTGVDEQYTVPSGGIFNINGGVIKNSQIYALANFGTVVNKSGVMNFTFEGNTLYVDCNGTSLSPVIVLGGGNSMVKNNNIYLDESGLFMDGLWILSQQSAAVSSTITNNTFYLESTNNGRNGVPSINATAGNMTLSYNQIVATETPSKNPTLFYLNNSTSVATVGYNNFLVADLTTAKHLWIGSSGGTINASNTNHFETVASCSDKISTFACGLAEAGSISVIANAGTLTKCIDSNITGCVGSSF